MAKNKQTDEELNYAPVTTDDIPIKEFKRNETGALMTRFGNYHLLVSCNRISDKKTIERFIRDYGIEKPAQKHEVEAFGFRIYADTTSAKVFRNSAKPIRVGREQWAFSLRKSSIEPVLLYGVTLEVFESDPPHRVDFTTQASIDAAMRVYRAACERAEFELRKELLRITTNAAREYKNPTKYPDKPLNPNQPSSPVASTSIPDEQAPTVAKKRLVSFKKR